MSALALYLATAALAVLGARRWVNGFSRWAAVALVLLPLAITGPALLRGRVYAPVDLTMQFTPWRAHRVALGAEVPHERVLSDLHCQIIPWHAALRRVLATGEWPLWNPYILTGDVLAGAAQPAPYSPLVLLSLILPEPLAPGYLASMVFLVGALGAFLFVRDLGCGEIAAGGAAVIWIFGDFLAFWVGWPMGAAASFLPWVWLGVRRLVARPGPTAMTLLGLPLALCLLSGHPETTAHVVFLGGLYALVELASQPRSRWGGIVGAGLAAGVVVLLLCAVYVLPVLDALAQSVELEARRAAPHLGPDLAGAAQRLVRTIVPFAFGVPGKELARMPAEFPAGAVGSVALVLAFCGVVSHPWRGRWGVLAIAVLGVLVGAHFPGVSAVVGALPPLDVALNTRLAMGASWGFAVLAALGLDAATRWPRPALLRGALVVGAVVALAAAAAWLPSALRLGLSPSLLRAQLLWSAAPPVVAALVLVVAGRRPPGVHDWRRLALLLVLVVLVQRWGETGSFYPSLPQRLFYPAVPPLDRLPDEAQLYRVVGTGNALVPNTAAVLGIEDVRGYQAMHLRRHRETYPLWCRPQGIWFNVVDDLSRPFLSFLNVRFAVVERSASVPPGWHVRARPRGAMLLENANVLLRAFVPRVVRVGGSPQAVLAEMQRAKDFRGRAWISLPGSPPVGVPREVAAQRGRVLELARRGTGYEILVRAVRPAWVVVSETAWRGWQATVAGRQLPVAYANHAFLAFQVPAGTSRVELRYRPRSFVVGRAVSGVTLAALLVAGVAAAVRIRRRHGPGIGPQGAALARLGP